MSNYTIYTLAESELTISGGAELDGVTQGDGSHLVGETITLDSNSWETVDVADGGTDSNFADTDSDQVLDGDQTLWGTNYTDGTRIEAEYTLTVEDGPGGTQYTLIGVNVNDSSPSYATIEALAFIGAFPPPGRPLTVVSAAEGPPNSGGSATPDGTYAVPPCFTAGAMIDTARGAVAVQDLRAGDRIWTLDRGIQPLVMTLTSDLSAHDLRRRPECRPVLIPENALGPGLPKRDMRVSPQHRVLLADWRADYYFGADEVLIAAGHLIGLGALPCTRFEPVRYHHLLLEHHEILRSDGLLSESFLPGEAGLHSLSPFARACLEARYATCPPPRLARPQVRRHEAALLAA